MPKPSKLTCVVSSADYAQYFGGTIVPASTVMLTTGYSGPERRRVADRRHPDHDRRWEACRGRRYRLADRRRTG